MRIWSALALLGVSLIHPHRAFSATGAASQTPAEARVIELEKKLDGLADDVNSQIKHQRSRIDLLAGTKIFGYVDVGYFDPQGSGIGFVPDTGNTQRGRFPTTPWILLGDPWSTPVNSRGEPANTRGSFAIPFDAIDSDGRASFIVNEIDLELQSRLASNATLNLSVDFLPRSGSGGRLGDLVDADFAYVEWNPRKGKDDWIQIGKSRSIFGLEYRRQESNDRTGIAPSLIHRYVGGHPVGIKGRMRWPDTQKDHWILHLALLNGNSHIEEFTFGRELASTNRKHFSSRLARHFVTQKWADAIEVGVSTELGPQTNQRDETVVEHQSGADLQLEKGPFELLAEFVTGRSPGRGDTGAQSLNFRGAYVQGSYQANNLLTPYVRWEFRNAIHEAEQFAYVIDISRVTAGLRVDINPKWIAKLEYLRNLEHGPVPDLRNDMFLVSQVTTF